MKVQADMIFKTTPSGDSHTLPIFVTDIMFHTDKKRSTLDMFKKMDTSGTTRVYQAVKPVVKEARTEEAKAEGKVSENWRKNCEGRVDVLDFNILMVNWGKRVGG